MTIKNFQFLLASADDNGAIDIDNIVAVKFQESIDTIVEEQLPTAFKRQAIIPYLTHTYIVYMDKFGNGYSRMIY